MFFHIAKDFLRFMRDGYCIVEKDKAIEEYKNSRRYRDAEFGEQYGIDAYVIESMEAVEERRRIIQEKLSCNLYATVRSINVNKVEILKK